MLMHAENSSLQDSSAQRRTDPVLPGIGVSPTASQTTALPHQCRKYLAKACQDCHHTLPRPPNLSATHLPTSLTRAHPPATHTTRSSRDNHDSKVAEHWGYVKTLKILSRNWYWFNINQTVR